MTRRRNLRSFSVSVALACAVAFMFFTTLFSTAFIAQAQGTGIATTAYLTTSPNPSDLNSIITFTAVVSSGTGNPIPTGTIQFLYSIEGGSVSYPLGSPVTLVNGQATYSTMLPAETEFIYAEYSPTGNFYIVNQPAGVKQIVYPLRIELNIIGSSAFWLEAGQGTQSFLAPCLWTENTNTVSATDGTAVDKGSAWVAWNKGSDSTCATASGAVYAYLNTDSVVGNRCLFNSTCTIAYPAGPVATANAIYPSTGTCGSTTTPASAPSLQW